MNTNRAKRTAVVFGPALAIGLAAATSSVRSQVGASNVGVALAIIVVLAALGSRMAGLVTAAAAAVSFNFFHTQPYHSLRIHEPRDVVIVALLAVLGLVVSDITAWRRRRDIIDFRHGTAAEAPKRLAGLLSTPNRIDEVWPALTTMILDQLSLADVWFDPATHTDLPLISRTGATHAALDDGFVLPAHGAAMPIVSVGHVLGHLVLRPQAGITSLWVERRVVVALADHLTIALTYTGHEPGRGSTPKGKVNNG